ncbi:unnamed protein product [Symbiodinium natans]|uniref:Uncharacterized protein n=1 Tax=Symbiodinium natans TaxID=878477 RepID=A0A812UGS1_9DINO|nr:unnamed protein product [Symbiodinium natans]
MYDPDFDWDEAERLLEEDSQATPAEPAAESPRSSSFGLVRLEKRAQWQAHDGQVNVALLENRGEAQQAFTGCWDSASLRCWDLAQEEPSPLGELRVGGFLNAVAKLRGDTALVAVSAGLIPTPGESLKVYSLSPPLPSPTKAESCFLHTRGCRALAVWPAPGCGELAASISKDSLAVSRVREGGGGILAASPVFAASNPHDMQEVTALCWQEEALLASGGTGGKVRSWDLNSAVRGTWTCSVSPGSWVRHLERCTSSGCLVVCHSDGLCWLDGRTGQSVGHVAGLGQAYANVRISDHVRIVAFGRRLLACDRRRLTPEAGASAELAAAALSLDLCAGAGGSLLVGSKDGVATIYSVHA